MGQVYIIANKCFLNNIYVTTNRRNSRFLSNYSLFEKCTPEGVQCFSNANFDSAYIANYEFLQINLNLNLSI